MSNTTTDLVEHKYGKDVAECTKDTFDSIGNVGKFTEVYGIVLSE